MGCLAGTARPTAAAGRAARGPTTARCGIHLSMAARGHTHTPPGRRCCCFAGPSRSKWARPARQLHHRLTQYGCCQAAAFASAASQQDSRFFLCNSAHAWARQCLAQKADTGRQMGAERLRRDKAIHTHKLRCTYSWTKQNIIHKQIRKHSMPCTRNQLNSPQQQRNARWHDASAYLRQV